MVTIPISLGAIGGIVRAAAAGIYAKQGLVDPVLHDTRGCF